MWGDEGDRFRTSRVRLNFAGRLFRAENVIFTGDPGLDEKTRDKNMDKGPYGTYIRGPYGDPDKYRHGVLSIGFGPISIG